MNNQSLLFCTSLTIFSMLAMFLYMPSMLMFYLVTVCLFFPFRDKTYTGSLFFIVVFFATLSLGMTTSSRELFQFYEDDFVSYYNNYVCFLSGGSGCLTEFGITEIGVPLVNGAISLILQENYPRVVLLIHSVFQVIIASLFIKKVSEKHSWRLVPIFFASLLIFYKYGALSLHLRQGYASAFIFLALLSTSRSRYILLLIAFFFHNSTIIIYPLCNFILKTSNKRRLIFSISMLLLLPFILVAFHMFSGVIYSIPLLSSRLGYILGNIDNSVVLANTFINALNRIVYILPIFLFSGSLYFIYRKESALYYFSLSFCLISFFLLSSSVPILQRLLAPVAYIYLGYLYADFFIKYTGRNVIKVILLSLWSFTYYRWFGDEAYFFSAYPRYSSEYLYYADSFTEKHNYINRDVLDYRQVE
ncbi:EpsG family protein [Vibrio splendidus]